MEQPLSPYQLAIQSHQDIGQEELDECLREFRSLEDQLNEQHFDDREQEDLPNEEKGSESKVDLNKLCLLNSKTFHDFIHEADSVQHQSDINIQASDSATEQQTSRNFEVKQPKFKLDLNFAFKDDFASESEINHEEESQNITGERHEASLSSQMSVGRHQMDLTELRDESAEVYSVPQKVTSSSSQIYAIKRNAEKKRREDIVATLSCEPNLKDVKSKVQSFNTNYIKPKFLKRKSRDVSQSSVQSRSRLGSVLDTDHSSVNKTKEERPPLAPQYFNKQTVKIEAHKVHRPLKLAVPYKVSPRKPQTSDSHTLKPTIVIQPKSTSQNSIKNLKMKYSTKENTIAKELQGQAKQNDSISVIKMKFKENDAPPNPLQISKYKQKRLSVVEINRLQLKLNFQLAKPQIVFESPQHSSSVLAPIVPLQEHMQSKTPPSSKQKGSSQQKPAEANNLQQELIKKELQTEISKIEKINEQNYESGEERSHLKDKSFNIKTNITDLDLVTNCTVDSQKNQNIARQDSKEVTSFSQQNDVQVTRMEQTFKPVEQLHYKTAKEATFYKSNTYLKMSSQGTNQSTFNTLQTVIDRENLVPSSVRQNNFRSIETQRNLSAKRPKHATRQASTFRSQEQTSSAVKLQQFKAKICRSAIPLMSENLILSSRVFEQEQLAYLQVIENLRSMITKPLTPQVNHSSTRSGTSQSKTTKPSDHKSITELTSSFKKTHTQPEESKKRLIFDLRLKKEISEIKLHLQASKSARSDLGKGYSSKWLALQVDQERRRNDQAEQEIKKMLQIRNLFS